ncbi:MAG: carboxylating nicotinate-nucleotide diphosphorylase [Candidatus Melainabacteria bacterium]|nr:carboxylating nicotinate-nucleotide diphosphorylase [Candidatus Melainabacteria bacterium]
MDGAIHKKKINLARQIVSLALGEDLEPDGDISTRYLDPEQICQAQILAKEAGVMSCSWLVELIFEEYAKCHPEPSRASGSPQIKILVKDGSKFKAGQVVIEIQANARAILACERSILNFLQRLCGIATYSNRLVELIQDYDCELLDTRKTMPGMRALEKQAFKDGGGTNHRFNLSDMIMLKENHLALAGADLISVIEESKELGKKIEVEINQHNLDKLDAVIAAEIDQIMLDNFAAAAIPSIIASKAKQSNAKFEASGGINESHLIDYSKTGVDYISTSICFTQAKNIDLSMLIK